MTAMNAGAIARLKAAAILAAVTLTPLSAIAAPDATGIWMNDTGRGAIEIKPCGSALCGHVVWVKDASDTKGCGRQIIGDATPINAGTWGNGWIYSPEKKRRYDVEFKPLDNDRLRVIGFAGSKFFSKTMIWKRAATDLQRCGETTAANPVTPDAPAAANADSKIETPAKSAAAVAKPAPAEPPATSGTAALNRAAARAAEAAAETTTKSPAPEASPTTAEASNGDTASDTEEQVASSEGPDVGELADKLGKYLKRDGDTCKLNLPWVKVDFKCE